MITCNCCANRAFLDGDDLVMINPARGTEIRVTLSFFERAMFERAFKDAELESMKEDR